MSKKTPLLFMLLLSVFALVMAACQAEPEVVEVTRIVTDTEVIEGEEVEVTRVVTEELEVTRVVEVEGEPEVVTEEVEVVITATPAPVERDGPWIDTVVVVEEPNADAGVSRLLAGDIDVYAFTISNAETAATITGSDELEAARSFGSYNELTFNPSACADGRLNPFSSARIREAMNWLVDREFIVQEINGGMGVPRTTAIGAASIDRARFAGLIEQLEAQYAYNPDMAAQVIAEEMEALGATMEGDTWTFNGAPVEIIMLIRTEDERRQIGDYVANQLESIGFTVVRDYRTSAEASPIWLQGDPTTCEFNIYTGGWVTTAIERDAGSNFEFFYTPAGLPVPLWAAYTPSEEFATLATRLATNDFSTLEERAELFSQILPLSLQNSVRIWLLDRTSLAPFRAEAAVAADLSGSIYGTPLWAHTIRREGEVGGSMTWAMPSILTQPWNPPGGSNWIYDQALARAITDFGVLPDPYTGLALPQRIESATVTVQEDLPVSQTLDWLTLEKVPSIEVPEDAWVDWDATNQVFLTAGEVYTETQTAALKSTVTYPADLYSTVAWHDGSAFDVADIVLPLIMIFDRAKPESAIFDEDYVPDFESFISAFKGVRIVSEDPLTVEWYTDNWTLDAESGVATLWPSSLYTALGSAGWHNMTLGIMAEAAGLAAFTEGKAEALEVEQMNYIAGPTVEILNQQLTGATGEEGVEAPEGFMPPLPYEATMSQYVTPEEAAARWANLSQWFERRGHFWLGTGPFFLQRAFPVEGTVILERNPNYPDPSDKWARFAEAPIPVVQVDGPGRVTSGDEATFDVLVSFNEEPYAAEDINEVQYLVFDATGALVSQGAAEAGDAGQWQVTLPADVTSGLEAGSNQLQVIVVSNLVAIPSTATFEFVTAP